MIESLSLFLSLCVCVCVCMCVCVWCEWVPVVHAPSCLAVRGHLFFSFYHIEVEVLFLTVWVFQATFQPVPLFVPPNLLQECWDYRCVPPIMLQGCWDYRCVSHPAAGELGLQMCLPSCHRRAGITDVYLYICKKKCYQAFEIECFYQLHLLPGYQSIKCFKNK